MSAETMAKYHIVLTTYDMVSRDWKGNSKTAAPAKKKAKSDGGLFGVKWKVGRLRAAMTLVLRWFSFQRIILDEGHNIRNPKTKTSQAICELEADRRWVVTGTPIVN